MFCFKCCLVIGGKISFFPRAKGTCFLHHFPRYSVTLLYKFHSCLGRYFLWKTNHSPIKRICAIYFRFPVNDKSIVKGIFARNFVRDSKEKLVEFRPSYV